MYYNTYCRPKDYVGTVKRKHTCVRVCGADTIILLDPCCTTSIYIGLHTCTLIDVSQPVCKISLEYVGDPSVKHRIKTNNVSNDPEICHSLTLSLVLKESIIVFQFIYLTIGCKSIAHIVCLFHLW